MGTGSVGKAALQHFAGNDASDLTGVYVTNPEKIGKDAGDPGAILAMDADCVHFAPLVPDIDMVCRPLQSGKNVVSPLAPFYNSERYRQDADRIEAACRAGRSSFHGSGIHPGFAGSILPVIGSRLMSRIDQLRIYEIVNFCTHPSHWAEMMGFGRDPDELKANTSRSPEAGSFLMQDMGLIADVLGIKLDGLTTNIEFYVARAFSV